MALRVFLNEIDKVPLAPVRFEVRQQVHVHMLESQNDKNDIDCENLLNFRVDLCRD